MSTFLFDDGLFLPYEQEEEDQLEWANALVQRGYAENDRVWGAYPEVYIKVFEARPEGNVEFPYVAILNLVALPHRVMLRDLNGLLRLLHLVMPLVEKQGRPTEEQIGDALSGTQDAD